MKPLLIISTILLAACSSQDASNFTDRSPVLAEVADIKLTTNLLDAFFRSRGLDPKQVTEQQQKLAVEQLITELSLASYADKKKISLSEAQQADLLYRQLQARSQAAVADYLQHHPIDEQQVKQEYEKVTKAVNGLVFSVNHMLFKDESQAIAELDKIKSGAISYEQAEKAYLEANSDMKNVGYLGWVNLKQLPPEFTAPLQTMENNSTYPKVVVSKFGAHIVHLNDKKHQQPPSFADSKDGIANSLRQKNINRLKQLAMAKAKITTVKPSDSSSPKQPQP